MWRQFAVCAALAASLAGTALADAQKPARSRSLTYDVTITVDGQPYTGTMVLAVTGGKVAGTMNIKQPGEITGKAAGTLKDGEMALAFPYHMVERKCDGDITMNIKLPDKPAATKASGTVSVAGCGRPDGNRLPGTIEMTPVKK
jgi:hypothetical protein